MTLEQYANLFNITGSGIVLLVSLVVSRSYPSGSFRLWIRAYLFSLAILCAEALTPILGRSIPYTLFELIVGFAAVWYFIQMGLSLEERSLPSRVYWLAMGILLLLSGLWLAAGLPVLPDIALVSLSISGAVIWLGVRLMKMGPWSPEGLHAGWLGWPLILLGLLPLTYPVAQATSTVWLGAWVSGLLHLLVGIGMVVYLLEEAAAELRAKNRKLVELGQLKMSFLSTISHELRTPLTSIVGYLEFLEDGIGGPLSDQQHEFVEQMKHGSLQLRELIESLLDTNQIEAGALKVKHEVLELPFTVDLALSTLQSLMDQRGLRLEVDVPRDLPCVTADSRRVVQVINNLVGNAIKFTESGGTIRVSARSAGGFVRVRVADTGIGIPSAKLPRIFEPFFQVDSSLIRRHGGSGLGLSIVKNMVEAMGGEVDVESKPGEGSIFSFTLPVARERSRVEEPS